MLVRLMWNDAEQDREISNVGKAMKQDERRS